MTVAIKHPDPQKRVHYVITPKKDITNVGTFSDEDRENLIDVFAVIQDLVRQEHLSHYEVITNGPGKAGGYLSSLPLNRGVVLSGSQLFREVRTGPIGISR
jgi:diadenosine tetraphosphate (Ap4A) HIT family hydrolase